MAPVSKLVVSLTSPFARKCRIAVSELGLSSQIDIAVVNPWTDRNLRSVNPLSKVPTLVLGDGTTLYDSRVILEYLDSLSPYRKIIPNAEADGKWQSLRLQALVDDACSAAGRLFAAEQTPGGVDASAPSKQRLTAAVLSTLDKLDSEQLNSKSWQVGELAATMLPSYYSFRFPNEDWRCTRPRLAKFVDDMEQHGSLKSNKFIG